MSRLTTYLAVTFLITWTCWWTLVLLAQAGKTAYGQPLFMLLYAVGGLGRRLPPMRRCAPRERNRP